MFRLSTTIKDNMSILSDFEKEIHEFGLTEFNPNTDEYYNDHPFSGYEYEEFGKRLSRKRKLRDVVILIEVDDNGDDSQWRCYFMNGKMQICEGHVVYEEFDATKLK